MPRIEHRPYTRVALTTAVVVGSMASDDHRCNGWVVFDLDACSLHVLFVELDLVTESREWRVLHRPSDQVEPFADVIKTLDAECSASGRRRRVCE